MHHTPTPATEPVPLPFTPAAEPVTYLIPPPADPTERATWEAAVRRRVDNGLGLVVGQDLICRDGTVLADERWVA